MEPLYKVQTRALVSHEAALESAERYAASVTPAYSPSYGKRFLKRLVGAYLAGLRDDTRAYRQDSNYDRPLARAWNEGRELRHELIKGGYFAKCPTCKGRMFPAANQIGDRLQCDSCGWSMSEDMTAVADATGTP
jgi:hypothetical protein